MATLDCLKFVTINGCHYACKKLAGHSDPHLAEFKTTSIVWTEFSTTQRFPDEDYHEGGW